jgi:hypothetical protein
MILFFSDLFSPADPTIILHSVPSFPRRSIRQNLDIELPFNQGLPLISFFSLIYASPITSPLPLSVSSIHHPPSLHHHPPEPSLFAFFLTE